MQIDPSQPIIFESDAFPGRGSGYWQTDPFGGSRDEEPRSIKARTPLERWAQIVAATIMVSILIGGAVAHIL